MMQLFRKERMWSPRRPLKPSYEVVIIGAGVHGLATAYYLAKMGVRDVAVVDQSYIGSGGSGRNTAIIRSNYRTPEGVAFYDLSVKLYEDLGRELDYNVLFSQHGHLSLVHTESGISGIRLRAEVNRLCGVDSRVIYPDEIRQLAPCLDLSSRPRFPICAALYHPPGGIIRHDAVVWAYARGADRLGGRVDGVETSRGTIKTTKVVNATAGWCSTIAAMVGVELPIVTHPLQALVTEPLKPFLDPVIVSATLHVYINQTDRGELVIGGEIDPYASYSQRSTLPFLETVAHHACELIPALREVRVLRQWAGICDMTPDYSPIIGEVPQVPGFYLDVGWGTYGFKAGPVAGKMLAEYIATGVRPRLIEAFGLERFYEDRLVGEKAAAAVSH